VHLVGPYYVSHIKALYERMLIMIRSTVRSGLLVED